MDWIRIEKQWRRMLSVVGWQWRSAAFDGLHRFERVAQRRSARTLRHEYEIPR